MRFAFAAVALIGFAAAADAAPQREPMDKAIERGLLYLRRTQNHSTGSWTGATLV